MKLSRDTVLQRVPDLGLRLDSNDNVLIVVGNEMLEFGPHALAILDAFSRPCSLADGLERLAPRASGAQDWIDLTGTIQQLYEVGVLQQEGSGSPRLLAEDPEYDAAPIHVVMLNDRARTAGFLAGIQEVVRPGDVVVDVGTGTGVLAVAAARAGARQVYAIEASGIGSAARAMFAGNGLAERITLVPGWSTQVSLPERADVLISELIGDEPLGERALEIVVDARKRLLKAEPRLVPARLKVFGIPYAIPDPQLGRYAFTRQAAARWRGWYGIDFESLARLKRNLSHVLLVNPHRTRRWTALSEPVLLADVDFSTVSTSLINRTISTTATASGRLSGLMVYFELQISPGSRLSTHPAQAGPDNSWRSALWIFEDAPRLRAGDRFAVSYQYGVPGIQSMVSVAVEQAAS